MSILTVTEQRLNLDSRIQADVMRVLGSNPDLSGKVGVESHDQVVTLSGYLATPGQVCKDRGMHMAAAKPMSVAAATSIHCANPRRTASTPAS